jgi:signal transduction histidine kinase/ABC-type branched-subunit amino acid transport system ATPase component
MSGRKIILRLEDIRHAYGHTVALNNVDFTLFEGEIHAIAGDHRSGKTTLGKIIAGAEKRQDGRIWFDGQELNNLSIQKAYQLGIGMVYQVQKNLVPSLNAVENIFSGNHRKFFITKAYRQEMEHASRTLLKNFNLDLPLDTPLYKLSEKDRQIINICHVLARKPRVLILDDIINTLLPAEVGQVFELLKQEKQQGTSIIYITSSLNDVFKIADRVTILQDGYRKGTEAVQALDPTRLVNLAFATGTHETKQTNTGSLLNSYQESMIDDLPIGEMVVNRSCDVVFMNQMAKKLLGEVPIQYRNKSFAKLLEFLPEQVVKDCTSFLTSGSSGSLEAVKIDEKVLKLTFSPIIDQNAERIGTNVFIEDMSFDYQTREYLMQANKNASVAALAAGVAHEIKNPLAIIQNYVDLIKLSPLEGECAANVEHIESELKRISEIVGNLLSFSRMNRLAFQPISLEKTLEEVLMLLGHKLSLKNIKLEKKFRKISMVHGDENKLKQLFINLIMNAQEAVLEDGSIELELNENRGNRTVSVIVSDNGHGISNQDKDKIFYPFYTTKMTRTNIGLGLSICQNIVELHGGVMKFSSEQGQKTSFIVTLPVIEREEDMG